MIPVKIQCVCGQKYAFEVEPAAGRMPSAIACPVCGVDGTAAANTFISQNMVSQPPAQPVSPPLAVRAAIHVATAAPATPKPAPVVGQLDRTQAEHEARAKVFWGDEQDQVVKFLLQNGFQREEALAMVHAMFLERAQTIRGMGVRKAIMGVGLMCVPVVAYLIFNHIGVLPIKLFGITVAVGIYGAWNVLKGVIMFLAPKSEPGDVADK